MGDITKEQQKSIEAGLTQYTVIEMYEALNPWNEDLPYVYESFAWDHCEEEGWPMDVQIWKNADMTEAELGEWRLRQRLGFFSWEDSHLYAQFFAPLL